jgi:hypothetical protein
MCFFCPCCYYIYVVVGWIYSFDLHLSERRRMVEQGS